MEYEKCLEKCKEIDQIVSEKLRDPKTGQRQKKIKYSTFFIQAATKQSFEINFKVVSVGGVRVKVTDKYNCFTTTKRVFPTNITSQGNAFSGANETNSFQFQTTAKNKSRLIERMDEVGFLADVQSYRALGHRPLSLKPKAICDIQVT